MKPDIPEEIQKLAEHRAVRCRVFSNTQRVLIFWLLAERKRTVDEVSLAIGTSLSNAAHHLRILGFNNLVEARHESDGIYYHLIDSELTRNCQVLADKPSDILTKVNPT